ncbi:MAG: phage major capsid protein, partial [Maritimibacter sp.]|nr:phage major capsid protein [Maritimibacter sp.]
MSNKETKAQGQPGTTGLSPAAEVKTAMAGFLSDIKSLHDDINSRLQQQEERLTMLDRKSLTTSRPALAAAADHDAPHQKAFEAYVRTGDDDGLRGLQLEGKALNTAVAGDGGYLVDPVTADNIASVLASTASIRAIANVVNVEATSYDVLIDHGDVGSGWAT